MTAVAATLRLAGAELRLWPVRRWVVAALTAGAVGLTIGIPTDVVPNPFYTRMTPVLWWSYPVWAATAVLGGLVAATYVRSPAQPARAGRALGGGLASFLAVGCPVCNKLVVALLGASGALAWFAPLQPLLAALGLSLLSATLLLRLRGLAACRARSR